MLLNIRYDTHLRALVDAHGDDEVRLLLTFLGPDALKERKTCVIHRRSFHLSGVVECGRDTGVPDYINSASKSQHLFLHREPSCAPPLSGQPEFALCRPTAPGGTAWGSHLRRTQYPCFSAHESLSFSRIRHTFSPRFDDPTDPKTFLRRSPGCLCSHVSGSRNHPYALPVGG